MSSSARSAALDGAAPRLPADDGTRLVLSDGNGSSPVEVVCESVHQRNWSRVGVGRTCGNGSSDLVFIKQSVDATGVWRSDLWQQESDGNRVATELLADSVLVPALRCADAASLICVFDHVDVVPMDVMLRSKPKDFEATIPIVVERMRGVLALLANGRPRGFDLPAKHRPWADAALGVSFKGFDIRNVGLRSGSESASPDVVMFDFGRPYLAPIQEPAAKLLVSIGLLNWGRPMRRFAMGPDIRLLDRSADQLQPFLNAAALNAELDLQASFRFKEVQGNGLGERLFKRLGMEALGRRYFRRLRNWVARRVGG